MASPKLDVGDISMADLGPGRRLSHDGRSQNSSSTSFAASRHSDQDTAASTPPSATTPDSASGKASVPPNSISKASTLVERNASHSDDQDDHDGRNNATQQDSTASSPAHVPQGWRARFRWLLFRRRSFNDIIAFLNLLVSVVALFLFGLLAYKIAVHANVLAKAGLCLNWDPAKAEHGQYPPWCRGTLDGMRNHYQRRIRSLQEKLVKTQGQSIQSLRTAANATLIALHHRTPPRLQGLLPARLEPEPPDTSTIALALALLGSVVVIILAVARLVRMRSNARRQFPPHQSSCNNEDQGRILVDYDGEVYIPKRHRPEEGDYLDRYATHIRDSMSSDSSGSSRSSSVFSWTSLTSRNSSASSLSSTGSDKSPFGDGGSDASEVKKEPVIQLPTKDNVKIFFDPETGEFIHLFPWTSQSQANEEEEQREKGDTQQALIQMAVGASAFASGKPISQTIQDALEDWEKQEDNKPGVPDIVSSNLVEPQPTAADDPESGGLQQRTGRVYEND